MKTKALLGISTDCTADITADMLEQYGVDVIYFYITTETGRFRDMDEITSRNVIDYIQSGKRKMLSAPPSVYEYEDFFDSQIKKYEKLIHICIGSKISHAYDNAVIAAKKYEGRITVIDSAQVSTGIAHVVLRACRLRDEKKQADEIAEALDDMKDMVSSSFSAESTEYLYYNGRIPEVAAKLCRAFNLHPILGVKNGYLKLLRIGIGNYDRVIKKYIKRQLSDKENIDNDLLFVTTAGCSVKTLNMVKKEIEKHLHFKEIIFTEASATVSGNCGPGTVGVLFVTK